MSEQKKIEVAQISDELWGENLWYRQLDQEGKDAVALTVYLMRNHRYIKAPLRFSLMFRYEIQKMLEAWKARK